MSGSSKEYRQKYYKKNKAVLKEYYRLLRLAEPERFRKYSREYMRRWRANNPVKARILGRTHQQTWRDKNPELNRLRAKVGMIKLKVKRKRIIYKLTSFLLVGLK